MNERYFLFRGCLIPTRLPFLERSSLFVLDKLGVDHGQMPGATCCVEPIGLRSLAEDTWLVVTARMLAGDTPLASSSPAIRLRLCCDVQVAIRSPMPARPAKVATCAPRQTPRRAISALLRVIRLARVLSP